MDPRVLTVYKSPFPKKRLGKDRDGGYVIVDIPDVNYFIFLACGVGGDISFEEDFINDYPNAKSYLFDGTVDKLPTEKDNNFTFIKKNIDNFNDNNTTNMHDIIDNNDNIFLKMDIEGAEIPWLKGLSHQQMNKFKQIVMEFHWPFSDKEIDAFNKINNSHYLVHFHGNNNCGVRYHNGVIIPDVFECTYLHKSYFNSNPELNTEPIPTSFDMPNLTEARDIYIDYPPFVFK